MKPFNLREHKETITSTNTLITNPLVNQKEPIMSNKVKLYTEDSVRQIIWTLVHQFADGNGILENSMKSLTPIELPSDEEINAEAISQTDKFNPIWSAKGCFSKGYIEGAKWVRKLVQ